MSFIATITPKEELVLACVLLFLIIPYLTWAIRHDLRGGETTITGLWTPPWKPIRRDENPSGFWQRIFYFSIGILAASTIAIIYVYDGLRRL